jgi:predicted dithiol-disulfide oxidoreductase (DUF899 family)
MAGRQDKKGDGKMATTVATAKGNAKVTTQADWLAARNALLRKEKEFDKLRDDLSRQRREMPWERVEKKYVFEGRGGKETLADLFQGRSQLIVYHFMLAPGWKEGCPGCSLLGDHFDGAIPHIQARDIAFVAASRATLPEIEAFKKRMGWKFKWVSSNGTSFNFDYGVSFTDEARAKGEEYYNYKTQKMKAEEMPGLSVFAKDAAGEVFHTYSTYARGLDMLIGAYNFIDLSPKGRDEAGLKQSMEWVRHHDKYEQGQTLEARDSYEERQVKAADSCCEQGSH